jgi:Pseudomurein-binding repeat
MYHRPLLFISEVNIVGYIINKRRFFTILSLLLFVLLISMTSISAATLNSSNTKLVAETAPNINLSLTQINEGLSRVKTFYNSNHRLPNYITYGKSKLTIEQFQQNITSKGQLVGGLSLIQINEGLPRVQSFYNTNHRLPNYVTYGTTQVPISQFKQIMVMNGSIINLNRLLAFKPIYITSDNIINSTLDQTRITSLINGLNSLGLKAYNMGLGPNYHIEVLQSSQVPKNALVVDIYGGADAGVLYEMGTSWYKSIKGTRSVFTVFWPPAKVITGLDFLERAHDDNYSPPSFTGLAHPDLYLLQNGYRYMYSGVISTIVNSIFYEATH